MKNWMLGLMGAFVPVWLGCSAPVEQEPVVESQTSALLADPSVGAKYCFFIGNPTLYLILNQAAADETNAVRGTNYKVGDIVPGAPDPNPLHACPIWIPGS
ncbi:MAG: hypothetical protein U0174_19650 [Polyangiaceae bacterium]